MSVDELTWMLNEYINTSSLDMVAVLADFRTTLWHHKQPSVIALVTLYSIVFVVGLVGNVVALIVLGRSQRLRSHGSFLLVNLLISDLLGK